jgi:hypothetical protein
VCVRWRDCGEKVFVVKTSGRGMEPSLHFGRLNHEMQLVWIALRLDPGSRRRPLFSRADPLMASVLPCGPGPPHIDTLPLHIFNLMSVGAGHVAAFTYVVSLLSTIRRSISTVGHQYSKYALNPAHCSSVIPLVSTSCLAQYELNAFALLLSSYIQCRTQAQ